MASLLCALAFFNDWKIRRFIMNCSKDEVMQYVREENVAFIRLAFCDVFGRQKNVSITPGELERAFEYGIAFDASSITGFGNEAHSDLFLHPDPNSLILLPWRPEHGRVVRMFSDITYPDGSTFECDTRTLLKKAVRDAREAGFEFAYGIEQEFYLFKLDDDGEPTLTPNDYAGYMDMAPDDRGENIRREICLMLEQMGIYPESSHHEDGPGQNEIDFRYSDALQAADNAETFQTTARLVAQRSGLAADFSAKPLSDQPGNGFHINMSVQPDKDGSVMQSMVAGVLRRVAEMSAFLSPTENSYERFGQNRAPRYISWSPENRSQLIRIPAASGQYKRAELRSPDPTTNPYLALVLMIYAGLEGIVQKRELPPAVNVNLFTADPADLQGLDQLPISLHEARKLAYGSEFIRSCIPESIIEIYCKREDN